MTDTHHQRSIRTVRQHLRPREAIHRLLPENDYAKRSQCRSGELNLNAYPLLFRCHSPESARPLEKTNPMPKVPIHRDALTQDFVLYSDTGPESATRSNWCASGRNRIMQNEPNVNMSKIQRDTIHLRTLPPPARKTKPISPTRDQFNTLSMQRVTVCSPATAQPGTNPIRPPNPPFTQHRSRGKRTHPQHIYSSTHLPIYPTPRPDFSL
jgi:hypothetical protein